MLTAAPAASPAETLTFRLHLTRDKVQVLESVSGAVVKVDDEGYRRLNEEGSPALPYRVISVLLPQGEEVLSYEFVVATEASLATGVQLKPAGPMIAENGKAGRGPGLVGRSGNAESFPGVDGRYLGTGYLHGRGIASFAVFPIRVVGDDLLLAESVDLIIKTEGAAQKQNLAVRERHREGFDDRLSATLSGVVINPEANQTYAFNTIRVAQGPGGFEPTSYPSLEGSAVNYVIITPDSLADEYQVLADWKTAKGVPTVVRTIEWIVANTRNGVDLAETIRFFVRDAYSKWGISYILLGGDTDVLPPRYALSRFYPIGGQSELPADMYFGCLDGSWNDDHDGDWGEVPEDNPDLYPEVYYGRIPISDSAEVSRMVDRVMQYESGQNRAYLDKFLMLAEVLFPEDWEDGDPIFLHGADFAESLYLNIIQPTAMAVARMYQKSSLYPGSVEETRAAVLDSLNAGYDQVGHIGHGFRFNASVGDASIVNLDADTLSNDGRWFNMYMLNCTAAAFDYFCLGEHFLQNPNGGAVSIIGANNSAFPFAAINYMSDYYSTLFVHDRAHIGEAFARSRVNWTPAAIASDDVDLWTHYIYTILAEPEMQLFTGPVDTVVVFQPSSVGLGDNSIAFDITAGGFPLDSAVVCLSKGAEDYAVGTTNVLGDVTIDFTAESPGSISVVVTGLNVARHQGYIAVNPSSAAYVAVSMVTVDDDSIGGSIGNGDGLVDAGETVDFDIELVNEGGNAAGGITLTISATDTAVTVVDGVSVFGDIGAGMKKTSGDPVRITFGSAMSDESVVEFEVACQDSGSTTWNDSFRKVVHGPILTLTALRIDDDPPLGDGDGVVGAGEEFKLYYGIKNFGTGTVHGLTARVEDISGAFTFVDSVDTIPNIGPMVSTENMSGFRMSESDTTVENSLGVSVTDNFGRVYEDTLELRPPAPPDSLVFDASLGPDRLEVTWSKSPSGDVARYNIYHSITTGGPYAKVNIDPVDHAVFVDAGLLPTCEYFYVITAIDSSGNESGPSTEYSASTNPPIAAGFPIELPLTTTSSPAVGDIDGDGDKEIVVGNEFVYAWHHDGFELRDGDFDPRSWGALNTQGDEFTAAITLGHMDNVPGLDIIAADLWTNSVYCMNYNGDLLPGWPQATERIIRAAPVVGDLDGDGIAEVIAVENAGVVYAWYRDGTEFIDGDSNPATPGVFFRPTLVAATYHTPSVCDIDGDLKDEIIFGTRTNRVYALNDDGSSVPGWPFIMNNEMVGGIVTGDIDGDRFPEIVARSDSSLVYVLNHDGTVASGWPVTIPYDVAYFRATPALADLDGDGKLEVVLVEHTAFPVQSRIHVVDYQGSNLPGWPVVYSTSTFSECSPVVADVDGDGFLDVVIGDDERYIYAWDRNGNPTPGFPIATQDAIRATPFIDDVDLDGDVDMVVYSWDQHIYLYDLGGAHTPVSGQWPTIHANSHRNGRAGSTVITGIVDASFRYRIRGETVSLSWVLPAPTFDRFDIRRAVVTGEGPMPPAEFVTVAEELSDGGSGVLKFDDVDVRMGERYVYRLESKDHPEGIFVTHPIYIPVGRAALEQNYPNPFNPTTRIVYYVPEGPPRHVSLVIYDVAGARVRTLVNDLRTTGRFVETWDGRNDSGGPVSSGVYFYRLVQPGFEATKKMLMLR